MNGAADSQPQATAVSLRGMRHAVILLAAVAAASGAEAKDVKIVRKSSALDFSYA